MFFCKANSAKSHLFNFLISFFPAEQFVTRPSLSWISFPHLKTQLDVSTFKIGVHHSGSSLKYSRGRRHTVKPKIQWRHYFVDITKIISKATKLFRDCTWLFVFVEVLLPNFWSFLKGFFSTIPSRDGRRGRSLAFWPEFKYRDLFSQFLIWTCCAGRRR